MNRTRTFKSWLEHKSYSKTTITGYVGALRNASKWFGVEIERPFFEMTSSDEIQAAADLLASAPDYGKIDDAHGRGSFSAAIKLYAEFVAAMNDFTWVTFYSEFADKLLPYKACRPALIDTLAGIFEGIGLKLPKLENDGLPADIDPFTVFGLFNKGISEKNRIAIVKAIATAFGIKAALPNEFPGVPVLHNLKATFYSFGEELGESDIDNLWSVFEAALRYADIGTKKAQREFIKCFDAVLPQKGILWNITMAMFWIRPYTFISLDSRNREFLKDSNYMPDSIIATVPKADEVPDGEEYLTFCENCKSSIENSLLPFKDFPGLSAYAWAITNMTGTDEDEDDGGSIGDADVKTTRYWMYSVFDDESWAECQEKGIMVMGMDLLGDFMRYDSKETLRQVLMDEYGHESSRRNQALMTWNFSRVISQNDVVIAKRGNTLLGKGTVTGDYIYDDTRPKYKNIRTVNWQQIGKWEHPGTAVAKRLTDITPYTEYVDQLCGIFDDSADETDSEEKTYPSYSRDDFLSEVYMTDEDYDNLVGVLENKQNIILQGAPGVGKTFAAKRLAYSIIGEKNPDRVQMVQFHQSYSYEDFIEGYRPASKSADGADFIIKKGSFYKFCKKAAEDDENDYFFIIDEINRGNLSKIFGELFMLIETDKRGVELQLLYSDEKFCVPKNVYIIGMMNTADRSLAMLDYALRRRFSFIDLKPGFETEGFLAYQDSLENEKFNSLINCVKQLNIRIAADASLGEGFCIGHSYFCNLDSKKANERTLSAIIEYELLPLLKEYWFDEPNKVSEWKTKLRNAIK